MHGKDITIPKGTEITAYINGDFNFDRSKILPTSKTGSSEIPSLSEITNVAISSVPNGADVEIDGNFVGNTPLSVSLPIGEHLVVVKKKGFKNWERKLRTAGTASNLSAELEQQMQ
jgi:CRISPR/Cas system-associated exonuclease Cas4 (RecB family)